MRLWSLHPSYLDFKGLNAVWREGLLAQAVLLGKTTAWKNHSQLTRFKNYEKPIPAIGFYLLKIVEEANNRRYQYNKTKIYNPLENVTPIKVTTGQLQYEWKILMERLKNRDARKYQEILHRCQRVIIPQSHSLFIPINGEVEPWEKSYQQKKTNP